MSEDPTLISTQCVDGVLVVTRDHPPVNALTLAMTRQLHGVLSQAADDPRVRAVVMTAAGTRSFGAGSDIGEFVSFIEAGDVVERKMAFENETFSLLATMPKPTIAALNGSAYGGGLEIALACDLIIAEHGQQVGLPEVRLGVLPGCGGAVRMVRRIGEARTKQMMFFGDPVPVETAHEWGLVNEVTQPDAALTTALDWAGRLVHSSAGAVAACKASVHAAVDLDRGEQAILDSLELTRAVFAHPDAAEGAAAFLEKRPAHFDTGGA
jgi:enoyl-CoA hydratase/carnithine racemase